MEDLFGINARRQAVAENIEKAMTVGFTPDEELEKALGAGYDPNGEDGNIEKAHQVGDIHPNGKWVWTQLPSGKYDWRTIKKNATEKKQEETGGSKEVDDFMDKVKTFNSKYTDTSKVSVIKTPKGNWDVSYDGHRLGGIMADQLSEKTAKKMGWLKEEKQEDDRKLSELGKNDTVAVVMERYNPQLGNYVTIERGTIDRVNKNSFSVTAGMITRKFDKQSGKRTDPSTDVYGSSTYSILTEKELNSKIKDGKFNGSRISRNAFENGKS